MYKCVNNYQYYRKHNIHYPWCLMEIFLWWHLFRTQVSHRFKCLFVVFLIGIHCLKLYNTGPVLWMFYTLCTDWTRTLTSIEVQIKFIMSVVYRAAWLASIWPLLSLNIKDVLSGGYNTSTLTFWAAPRSDGSIDRRTSMSYSAEH